MKKDDIYSQDAWLGVSLILGFLATLAYMWERNQPPSGVIDTSDLSANIAQLALVPSGTPPALPSNTVATYAVPSSLAPTAGLTPASIALDQQWATTDPYCTNIMNPNCGHDVSQ